MLGYLVRTAFTGANWLTGQQSVGPENAPPANLFASCPVEGESGGLDSAEGSKCAWFSPNIVVGRESIRVELAKGVEAEEVIYSQNLSTPPKQKIFNAREIMIGDAHGNVLRILYDLIYGGVFQSPKQETWDMLIGILKNAENLTYEQLLSFSQIICCSITPTKNPPEIIFIGDLLADRQGNDVLMLTLFFEMTKKNLQYKILLSNHDLDFLRYYCAGLSPITKNARCSKSLLNFVGFMENFPLDDICNFVKNYLKNLELFEYRPAINLFVCHATIRENHIQNLCRLFNVKYSDNIEDVFLNLKSEFEKIKNNKKLLQDFLQERIVQDFCWARVDDDEHVSSEFLPGIETLVQGHDFNDYYFTSVPNDAYPLSRNECVGGKRLKRVVIDNLVGKDAIGQTHDRCFGLRLKAYLVIIPKDQDEEEYILV